MSLSSLHDAIDNWSLNTDRPFSNLSTKEIVQGAIHGLDLTRPDLEVATIALSELEHRTLNAALNGILEIQDSLAAGRGVHCAAAAAASAIAAKRVAKFALVQGHSQ